MPIHDIHDLKKIARRDGIRIAVIAVPAPPRSTSLDLVVGAGNQGGAEFLARHAEVPPDVKLKSVDLTVSLESLSFFLAQGDGDEVGPADGRTVDGRERPSRSLRPRLSHVDARGRVKMVDVGDKPVTAARGDRARLDHDVARGARADPHRAP